MLKTLYEEILEDVTFPMRKARSKRDDPTQPTDAEIDEAARDYINSMSNSELLNRISEHLKASYVRSV